MVNKADFLRPRKSVVPKAKREEVIQRRLFWQKVWDSGGFIFVTGLVLIGVTGLQLFSIEVTNSNFTPSRLASGILLSALALRGLGSIGVIEQIFITNPEIDTNRIEPEAPLNLALPLLLGITAIAAAGLSFQLSNTISQFPLGNLFWEMVDDKEFMAFLFGILFHALFIGTALIGLSSILFAWGTLYRVRMGFRTWLRRIAFYISFQWRKLLSSDEIELNDAIGNRCHQCMAMDFQPTKQEEGTVLACSYCGLAKFECHQLPLPENDH